jgi:hypothetical protein
VPINLDFMDPRREGASTGLTHSGPLKAGEFTDGLTL